MAVVEKAIAPNSFLLLPVEISSGTSKFSVLPVHCPPARTMDCTRSFMAGMQMKANESAWLMYLLLLLSCIINDLVFVYGLMQVNIKDYNHKVTQLWHAFSWMKWVGQRLINFSKYFYPTSTPFKDRKRNFTLYNCHAFAQWCAI